MQAGKFISASEINSHYNNDLFPCFGGNGLRGFTKIFNHIGNYALIGRQGALCGNVTFTNGKFYATEHAVVVSPNDEINSLWMFYLLIHLNLNQYATGMAQPGLSVQNLYRVETAISKHIREQQKISSLLSLIDERISKSMKIIKNLESLMTGYRENIFSHKLRFKDEHGNDYPNCKMKTLGEVLIKNSNKNKGQKISLVQSVSNKYGFVNQDQIFEDRRVASKDTSNYYIIKKGHFAYNPSRIDVGSLAYKYDNEISVISPLYISFSANENYLKDGYLLNWFSSKQFLMQMKISFEGSVRNTLSYESLIKMKISIPSIGEQNKIAKFLSSFDEKINLEKDLLTKYENKKKYLLSNLFI